MYYILQNDKIVLFDNDKNKLKNTLLLMPQYQGLDILQTEREIIELNNEFVFKDEVEEKLEAKEKERIAKLYLTRADVERGIYQAKGMDFEDIITLVTQLQPQGLDIKALKIELKANNFYRGNPYVSAIGALLGFTDEQLDLFFETNDYTVLLPKEEPTDPQEGQDTGEVEPVDDPSLTQGEEKVVQENVTEE